jgi:hypothetical protein
MRSRRKLIGHECAVRAAMVEALRADRGQFEQSRRVHESRLAELAATR